MSSVKEPISLQIPDEKYRYLLKTLDEQKSFLFKIKMNPLIRDEMVKGLRIIGSILTTTKKEMPK